jgi:MFS-type transporter involved in bile tolerance (Atg22 family)
MTLSSDPNNKNSWMTAFNMKALTVGGEVGCLTLFIVLVAVFGGIWLDRVFDTKPVIMLILVLGSAPLSLVITFWIAKRAVKDMNMSKAPEQESKKKEITPEGDNEQ